MEHCSCSRSCSSDLADQVFKDPDETVETLPMDSETMEGGSIEFKQVGGDSFGLLVVVVGVADTFCAHMG